MISWIFNIIGVFEVFWKFQGYFGHFVSSKVILSI